jgi:predicted transcriptional regulator
MTTAKLSPLELQIMEIVWSQGRLAVREVQEAFPEEGRPAYTTIQTTMYRLEEKGALRRVRKIGNAHVFEAVITRQQGRGTLIDEFLKLFGGRPQPVMAHLVETGQLTLDDVKEAEKLIKEMAKKKS